MGAPDISLSGMLLAYLLLLPPLGIGLWLGVGIVNNALYSVLRMTVQLLFVGLYLQYVFVINNPWLTAGWLLCMIIVADFSIVRSSSLRLRKFFVPVLVAVVTGTALPLLVFILLVLGRPMFFDAPLLIPLGGMVLGNCLRANIIGLGGFYESIRSERKKWQQALLNGASRYEAARPFLQEALNKALSPTLANMATIGLVSLPGMMTGVILGGTDPAGAVKYQIAIMLAILCGTTITAAGAIIFTIPKAFDKYGLLEDTIFREK